MSTDQASRIRLYLQHLLVPSDFYEPLDRYKSQDDFIVIARHLLPDFWRIVRDGPELISGPVEIGAPGNGVAYPSR